MTGLLALLIVPLLAWALLRALRLRRTRDLVAHRISVIKDGLERARLKPGHGRPNSASEALGQHA